MIYFTPILEKRFTLESGLSSSYLRWVLQNLRWADPVCDNVLITKKYMLFCLEIFKMKFRSEKKVFIQFLKYSNRF